MTIKRRYLRAIPLSQERKNNLRIGMLRSRSAPVPQGPKSFAIGSVVKMIDN